MRRTVSSTVSQINDHTVSGVLFPVTDITLTRFVSKFLPQEGGFRPQSQRACSFHSVPVSDELLSLAPAMMVPCASSGAGHFPPHPLLGSIVRVRSCNRLLHQRFGSQSSSTCTSPVIPERAIFHGRKTIIISFIELQTRGAPADTAATGDT